MPTYPDNLPTPLSRSDLGRHGIGWRETAGPLWRAPFRGVHVWSALDADTSKQRALDASGLVPPGGAIGGWAAAVLAGVEEIDDWWGSERQPVLLCLPPNARRRRGPHLGTLRSPLDTEDVVEVEGVPVTSSVRTAFDLCRRTSLLQGVTVLDVLGRGRPDFASTISAYVEERRRWGGATAVRAALERCTDRARSPRETALRLFWTDECGLAPPLVNAVIRDSSGRLLGMGDLLDPETGLLVEYDGSGHRQERQHALDNAREEALEDAGLTVVRVSNPDLGVYRRRTRSRVENGLVRARSTPRGLWTWEPGPLPTPVPHW